MRILVLVLLLWTTSAQAGTNSLLEGTDVWNNCADPRTDQAAMWCQGFTAGVVDGLSFPNPEAIWKCIPAGVTGASCRKFWWISTQLAVKAVHQARPDMTASEILDAVRLVQRQ